MSVIKGLILKKCGIHWVTYVARFADQGVLKMKKIIVAVVMILLMTCGTATDNGNVVGVDTRPQALYDYNIYCYVECGRTFIGYKETTYVAQIDSVTLANYLNIIENVDPCTCWVERL